MPQVSAWDTDHLRVAAARWKGVAQSWDEVFATAERDIVAPGGTPWLGTAAEGAQQRCAFDRVKVGSSADDLYSAAEVAGRGADRLAGAKQIVLDAVARAREDGFAVGDDFSVSDPQSHATAVVRQAQAQAHAGDIRVKVAALVQADREVAAAIREAGGRIGDIDFDSSIQALDGEEGEAEPPRTRGLPPEGLRPPVEGDCPRSRNSPGVAVM